MTRARPFLAVALAALMAGHCLTGVAQAQTAHPELWPQGRSHPALTDPALDAWVAETLASMTLEEKVGQLIQADIGAITPKDLADYPIGSILAGGSSSPGDDERAGPQAWLDLARAFRQAAAERPGAKIPLLFGVDAVHGHNNLVGATLFPHNIGLGAAGDPDLVRRIAEATALEVAVTGIDWSFGPTLAVPRDDRWGRTYEGYAEDPAVHRRFAGPFIEGLQGPLSIDGLKPGHVMASAKHFLADGGTTEGRDRGDAAISEQELIDIHLSGYPQAIEAGALSVMVSFSGWNGVKHTGNASLLTGVLQDRLDFRGLTIGDWDAHAFVPGCTADSCPQAINAGLDMFMAPNDWKALYRNTLDQARLGEIPAARLDAAVSRILRAKRLAGAFAAERPIEGRFEVIGMTGHRELAREAVRKSLVLLKNDGVLPIRAGARVMVAGAAADDIGQAAGGWTISWQGTGNTNTDFPGATSIWAGLREAVQAGGGTATFSPDGAFTDKPDVAVVVFGETPYAEHYGDLSNLDFEPTEPLETLLRLKRQGVPTVAVFLSGRPMWTNPEINAADAFVAAWLPGGEGAGVADVLVGAADGSPRHDFTGKLTFSWPRSAVQAPQNVGMEGYDLQFAFGFGLSYARPGETGRLSEESGLAARNGGTVLFDAGRFPAPWALTLRDGKGGFRVEAPGAASSPGGLVSMRPIDGRAQESARLFTFSGPASIQIGGPSRRYQADEALHLRYKVGQMPTTEVRLTLGGRSVALDLAKDAGAGWQELVVPFRQLTDAAFVETGQPFHLQSDAGLTIALEALSVGDGSFPSN